MKTLNVNAFGLSLAVFGALGMLIMALLAMAGYYTEAWDLMAQFHVLADLTVLGVIGGMIEAALWSYVSGVLVAWVYNRIT
ncbi:MAG: hypothetical protein Q8O95_02615 [bacterium]|nr:hypothetical protein [bacterium]